MLSKKTPYALKALGYLASKYGEGPVLISEISTIKKIPIKFLEAILVQLKDAGYLDSKRGKLGGVFLKQPSDQISIGSVVRLIDGPLAPIRCASVTAYEPCSCPDEEHCGLRMLMVDVRNATANILDRYTLADTVAVTLRKIRHDKVPLPFLKERISGLTPRRASKRPAAKAGSR